MSARDARLLAVEEVAQIRHAATIISLFAAELDRRDTDLQSLLTRALTLHAEARGDVPQGDPAVYAALAADHIQRDVNDLASQQAALVAEVRRLAAICEREPLVSEGFVIQSNEILRNLRDDIHKQPALTSNAVALAVGGTVQGLVETAVAQAVARILPDILATIPEIVAAAVLAMPPAPVAAAPLAVDPLVIVDIEASPAPRSARRRKTA